MMIPTRSPELEIPQARPTSAAPPTDDPAPPFHAQDLPPYARADRPLARLTVELRRLSAHRDDATAVRALALLEEVLAAGPGITALAFERVSLQLLERRHAHGDPARPEWFYAYRLACDALQALVWAWRLRVLESISAGACGDAAAPSRGGSEDRP